ncbi:glycosyltransferase family 2 protein [Lapillicoccus jejuensis]|uniref:Glycosyl transferase family 2 n=1 Tax=Lapillicoccus jejuensis TaxID=402171 RepID=A0A542DVW7_9MICO|nr:glycosyltransferase [Lapillicoccus jejuensis]TQJ07251.1 glycosyl transferase family 2 [Lapillicoccus jejuensis]
MSLQDAPTGTPAPTVSIVTRTRDRAVLFERALRSVRDQTFTDYELVVVDDAGRPGSVQEVLDRVEGLPAGRVRIVRNEESGGREAAMNTGVGAATGELLVLHDDDDSWHPGFLEATVAHLRAHPDHLGVATRTELVVERLEDGVVVEQDSGVLAPELAVLDLAHMVHRNYAPPISFLYRRAVHDAVGPYDGSLPVLADWEFMLRLLAHGPAGFLPDTPLARWHHRPDDHAETGNSVITAQLEHQRYEVLIRERYLRAAVASQPAVLGLLLELARQEEQAGAQADGRAELLRAEVIAMAQSVHARLDTGPSNEPLGLVLQRLEADLVTHGNRVAARFDALEHRLDELRALQVASSTRARLSRVARLAARLVPASGRRG